MTKEKQTEAEEDIAATLGMLEAMCPQVFYLPGNHDPPMMHEEGTTLTPYSISIQRSIFHLSKNLYMIGIGGSNPALFKDADGEHWDPYGSYPWKDDEAYGREIRLLQSKAAEIKSKNPEAQFIWATHFGP